MRKIIAVFLAAVLFLLGTVPALAQTDGEESVLAPVTGDINVMILVAVVLILVFVCFIILRSKRQ